MKPGFATVILALTMLWAPGWVAAEGEFQFADLGTCQLESGQVISDCRIGYRIYGRLNSDKSNAVLVPSWFSGTSGDLADAIGSGKLVDSARYFVVLVDALGNGVSSSPSNSQAQPGPAFPSFTLLRERKRAEKAPPARPS